MINIQDLSLTYPDGTQGIDHISFTAAQGENIALIGENGAGKTSLLLAVVGILESTGIIEIDQIRLSKKSVNDIRNKTGFVFQNPDDQLFMPYIFDDIAFGCRNNGMPEDMVKIHVDAVLSQLHLEHLRNRSSLKLSGGEKRMAAIATVMAQNPAVLLFDEPTAFLDPKARRALVDALQKMDHTKIIATHDLFFAKEICSRVIILQNGSIAFDGNIDVIYDKNLMVSYGLEGLNKV